MTRTARIIPSIEQLRQRQAIHNLELLYGRESTIEALRTETSELRQQIMQATIDIPDAETAATYIIEQVAKRLEQTLVPTLSPVINGTGVIIHTNLGRAPLGQTTVKRITQLVERYNNLEYDLDTGTRSSRSVHTSLLLNRLTGAEASAVVNNNAAAILLVLTALARGREVIISRGEMVEIGGGFRIPDVMRQSGAHLREIGTTNKTRASDYASAINDRTAMILRVHPSNFTIEGFTERPRLKDLTAIGNRFGVPVVEDLGSGCLSTAPAIMSEPTVEESIDSGVSVCTFSGDKLLGGPQAGLIVGKAEALETIHKHPLMRALRVGKLTLAALEATLFEHATSHAKTEVPIIRMIALKLPELRERASAIEDRLSDLPGLEIGICTSIAKIGGGSSPQTTLESCAINMNITGHTASAIDYALRHNTPAVVGRIEDDQLLLDLRTIAPEEDGQLVDAISTVTKHFQSANNAST